MYIQLHRTISNYSFIVATPKDCGVQAAPGPPRMHPSRVVAGAVVRRWPLQVDTERDGPMIPRAAVDARGGVRWERRGVLQRASGVGEESGSWGEVWTHLERVSLQRSSQILTMKGNRLIVWFSHSKRVLVQKEH